MNPIDPPSDVDPRREVDRYLGNYSEDHRNALNVAMHHVCVPLVVWSIVAVLWVVPVPPGIGRQGLWAALALVGAFGFYLRLSRPLAFATLLAFALLFAITELMYRALGASGLLWTAVGVFVVAWIGQFIGHHAEGKRPSFFTDLVYLLIGPIWLVAKTMRRLGIAY